MITQCYTDSTIFKCLKKTCAFIFYFIKLHKAHFPKMQFHLKMTVWEIFILNSSKKIFVKLSARQENTN